MADPKLDRLLADAQRAYQNKDRRKGAQLIDQILKQDYNHAATWEYLHRLFGRGQTLQDFQISFSRQFYPDKVTGLQQAQADAGQAVVAQPPPAPAPPAKKPGFFARLFGVFRRKPKSEVPIAASAAGQPQASVPGPSGKPAAAEGTPKPAASSLLQSAASMQAAQPSATSSTQSASVSGAMSARPSGPVGQPGSLPAAAGLSGGRKIQLLVVDDIPQTRETVIRSLRFQENIEVIGSATNGIQAIQMAKQLQPDVIVMDVNMPDMDGITATANIKREVPHTEIIILTVQDDIDYLRKSMMAGARDFLAKPPMIEDLIAAIERAAEYAWKTREKTPPVPMQQARALAAAVAAIHSGGKVITVYSPRGGLGCTTLASNLAICLQSEEEQVALVDGNLQFGDLPVFFNVQSKNSIVDLAPRVGELDPDLVREVMITHNSGVKILAPPRPERAELVAGPHFSQLLQYMSQEVYPYIVVDTTHRLSEVTLAALDTSDVIVLVVSQDVPAIARMRKFIDLLPILNLDTRRMLMVINQYDRRIAITPEKLSETFKIPVAAVIPLESDVVVPSINRGVPFMAQKENLSRPVAKATQMLAEAVRRKLTELEQAATAQ